MASFDEMFPNRSDCYLALFQDAVYEHDNQSYLNEYFAYFLICLALHTQTVNLSIHENKEVFKEFLNQLHFRNLSRSSLEFFLPNSKDRT